MLCFVPRVLGTEGLAAALLRLSVAPETVCVEDSVVGEQWAELIEGHDCVVVWVACRQDLLDADGEESAESSNGFGADVDEAYESALCLLRAATQMQKPSIALGQFLNPALKSVLSEVGATAYVSTNESASFGASFVDAYRAIKTSLSESRQTRCYNTATEVLLRIGYESVTWEVTGGYRDRYMGPGTALWERELRSLTDFAHRRSLDASDMREQVENVAKLLGRYLLPKDGEALYLSLHDVVGNRASEVPVFIAEDDDHAGLPFELTTVPHSGQHLCHLHPVFRYVRGVARRHKWRPPNRGLRVLLIGSNVGGVFECPNGQRLCGQAELPELEKAEREISDVAKVFRQHKPSGLVSKVESLVGGSHICDVVAERLSSSDEWDIIHFAGHGLSCPLLTGGRQAGCLFLRKSRLLGKTAVPIPASYWAPNLIKHSPHALTFFSCCRSADNGLARSLAAGKPSEAIGYQYSAYDLPANRLAVAFYAELLRAMSQGRCDVGKAMLEARLSVLDSDAGWLTSGFCSIAIGDQYPADSPARTAPDLAGKADR